VRKKNAIGFKIREGLEQPLSASGILVVLVDDEANKHERVLTLELSGGCRGAQQSTATDPQPSA